MAPELLERIMDKAVRDYRVLGVGLYNWTEPMIHPRLPELIRIVQTRGVPCSISTNLNLLRDADALLAAAPHVIYVSLSGLQPQTYAKWHRGGEIARVLEHLDQLVAAKRRAGVATQITLIFHRYRDNLAEEAQVVALAERLGLGFMAQWAQWLPLEKLLAWAGGGSAGTVLTGADRQTIDGLALPPGPALALARSVTGVECALRHDQIVLDCRGDLQLCCAVFDAARYGLGSFLDLAPRDIRRLKAGHPACVECGRVGASAYYTYAVDGFDALARAHVAQQDQGENMTTQEQPTPSLMQKVPAATAPGSERG